MFFSEIFTPWDRGFTKGTAVAHSYPLIILNLKRVRVHHMYVFRGKWWLTDTCKIFKYIHKLTLMMSRIFYLAWTVWFLPRRSSKLFHTATLVKGARLAINDLNEFRPRHLYVFLIIECPLCRYWLTLRVGRCTIFVLLRLEWNHALLAATSTIFTCPIFVLFGKIWSVLSSKLA